MITATDIIIVMITSAIGSTLGTMLGMVIFQVILSRYKDLTFREKKDQE